MKILVTYDMFREGFTELESKYEVTFPEGRDFTYEEVFEMIPEYDVLCSMFDFPVNKELIDHASKLRLIANYAVGYNNIDVAYALEKGLTVANTPDPVTAIVVDHIHAQSIRPFRQYRFRLDAGYRPAYHGM